MIVMVLVGGRGATNTREVRLGTMCAGRARQFCSIVRVAEQRHILKFKGYLQTYYSIPLY